VPDGKPLPDGIKKINNHDFGENYDDFAGELEKIDEKKVFARYFNSDTKKVGTESVRG
jgi:hypothetical protein